MTKQRFERIVNEEIASAAAYLDELRTALAVSAKGEDDRLLAAGELENQARALASGIGRLADVVLDEETEA